MAKVVLYSSGAGSAQLFTNFVSRRFVIILLPFEKNDGDNVATN
jgi:hypothetical protein